MANELLLELNKLKKEKTNIKRNLDRYYRNYNIRSKMFLKLKEIEDDIKRTEFKLKLEEELKNGNNNTFRSSD